MVGNLEQGGKQEERDLRKNLLIELMDQMIADDGVLRELLRERDAKLQAADNNEEVKKNLEKEYEPKVKAAQTKADESYKTFHKAGGQRE